MDNFKTFQEDLSSGRPAKKPVSSNLLKQRAMKYQSTQEKLTGESMTYSK